MGQAASQPPSYLRPAKTNVQLELCLDPPDQGPQATPASKTPPSPQQNPHPSPGPSPSPSPSPSPGPGPSTSPSPNLKAEALPQLPPKFQELQEQGYQVLPNILSPEECDRAVDGVWDWLGRLGVDIQRDDCSTWGQSTTWPCNNKQTNIFWMLAVGQEQFVWDVRQNSRVLQVFRELWGEEDLLVSFDGINVIRPPELTGEWADPSATWFHVDQCGLKRGRHCVQGFVTLEDVLSDDGTLEVLAKSHKHHDALFNQFHTSLRKDFVPLSRQSEAWMLQQPGVERVRVAAPKGSLVLWDSRTVHQGAPPLQGRGVPHWRYIVYLCYMPRRLATEEGLGRKRAAFRGKQMTSHWPCEPAQLKSPVEHLGLQPSMELPKLSDLGWRLAGFG